jgi:hypothetical protein
MHVSAIDTAALAVALEIVERNLRRVVAYIRARIRCA